MRVSMLLSRSQSSLLYCIYVGRFLFFVVSFSCRMVGLSCIIQCIILTISGNSDADGLTPRKLALNAGHHKCVQFLALASSRVATKQHAYTLTPEEVAHYTKMMVGM